MPLMREAIRAFGLEPIELERYEADDLIATYTQEAKARGADVLIVSSDKDLMQLVGPLVRFYDFESGQKGKPGYRPERNLDEAAVTERWEGIPPEKIGDVLALMGDTRTTCRAFPASASRPPRSSSRSSAISRRFSRAPARSSSRNAARL